jgi:hypothetical protein
MSIIALVFSTIIFLNHEDFLLSSGASRSKLSEGAPELLEGLFANWNIYLIFQPYIDPL